MRFAPTLAGTWQSKPGEVEQAVETALKHGYKLLDCAAIYGNEAEVGEGIRRSGVKPDDIWITSKVCKTPASTVTFHQILTLITIYLLPVFSSGTIPIILTM
jgi:diketogulonate reductase-like aldo/keto reductase